MRLRVPTRLPARAAVLAVALATPLVAATPASAHSDTLKAQLHRLRVCESGNRYHANTGNGYYGAYQFAAGTWHSLGYHGLPSNAPARRQDAAARKLHAQSGWRPWPACARREHLH